MKHCMELDDLGMDMCWEYASNARKASASQQPLSSPFYIMLHYSRFGKLSNSRFVPLRQSRCHLDVCRP